MGGASATSQSCNCLWRHRPMGHDARRGGGVAAACYSSRGAGGAGGGSIDLTVKGALLLDGRISADGSPGLAEGSGGGSGGSISMTVGTLAGGRNHLGQRWYGQWLWLYGWRRRGRRTHRHSVGGVQYSGYLFFGAITARGGGGSAWGGAGTIYTSRHADLQPGAGRQWRPVLAPTRPGPYGNNFDYLTVQGGAVVVATGGLTIGTLLVASNGWLRITNQP